MLHNFQQVNNKDLAKLVGGARGGKYHYYGNGLSCNRRRCRVDWSRTWYCIGNRAAAAFATGGKATIGRC